MDKEIEQMEKALKALKEAKAREERLAYERKPHRGYKEGDLVCKGKEWGRIGWVDNQGYCGIAIKSGSRGFRVSCRIDEWTPMDEGDKDYLTQKFKVELTGEEIQELLYKLSVSNWSKMADEVRKKLEKIGRFSFNAK
nr:hypothetical protein [uncultured Prevotella sp.]